MANEILLPLGTTGISGLYCRTVQGTTLGTAIALSEISGSGGIYAGDMAGAAGSYSFAFYDSVDALIATADSAYWEGANFSENATATNVSDAQSAITAHTRPMAKQLGLVAGVTATHTDDGITVSDGDGSTTTTDNGGGSYTVEGA